MTLGPAYAAFQEDLIGEEARWANLVQQTWFKPIILGSLIPGKRADIVVLDHDIMRVPSREILETRVIATLVDGAPVYGHI